MERKKEILKSGVKASKITGVVASENAILVEALEEGLAGNALSITYVKPGGNNATLSVDVVGKDITVNLATNGVAAATSTADQVIDESFDARVDIGRRFGRHIGLGGKNFVGFKTAFQRIFHFLPLGTYGTLRCLLSKREYRPKLRVRP